MYEIEIVIQRAAYPFRVTGVASEARAFEIIESMLAAWTITVPISLREPSEFAAQLGRKGSYKDTADDAKVKVQRVHHL